MLANEQVVDGKCWRCDSEVTEKELEQWMLNIRKYADELLSSLDGLDKWPEPVKIMQQNWIGRSEGTEIVFPVDGSGQTITAFTTRPDTLFGVTYMVLAPEHPLVSELTEGLPERAAIEAFAEKTRKKSRIDRMAESLEKEGVFTGQFFKHPLTGEKMPIYIADYVLMDYGTGAVMAVPGHDQRDFEFAKKYELPIRVVITPDPKNPMTAEDLEAAYVDQGYVVNSGEFDGQDNETAKRTITEKLRSRNLGEFAVTYRVRDWLISRQRYWGTPIPVLYCKKCGIVPVPESELPVELPDDVSFTGEGNPLDSSPSFAKTACPKCGGDARRETDTMDTFFDSSWYFLRYISPALESAPFCKEDVDAWMPVDHYIGGITHATMHLLYARFFIKALRDIGLLSFDEPFSRLTTQGMVLKNGEVMSKSKGNVIDPGDLIENFGADATRAFMLFAAPPEKEYDWNEEGIFGISRFLNRVWTMVEENTGLIREQRDTIDSIVPESAAEKKAMRAIELATKQVTDSIENLHFNTGIAALMELFNELRDFTAAADTAGNGRHAAILARGLVRLVSLLNPFAPHISEELWEIIGGGGYLSRELWPEFDTDLMAAEEKTIAVQVNGKLRGNVSVPADLPEEKIRNGRSPFRTWKSTCRERFEKLST